MSRSANVDRATPNIRSDALKVAPQFLPIPYAPRHERGDVPRESRAAPNVAAGSARGVTAPAGSEGARGDGRGPRQTAPEVPPDAFVLEAVVSAGAVGEAGSIAVYQNIQSFRDDGQLAPRLDLYV